MWTRKNPEQDEKKTPSRGEKLARKNTAGAYVSLCLQAAFSPRWSSEHGVVPTAETGRGNRDKNRGRSSSNLSLPTRADSLETNKLRKARVRSEVPSRGDEEKEGIGPDRQQRLGTPDAKRNRT